MHCDGLGCCGGTAGPERWQAWLRINLHPSQRTVESHKGNLAGAASSGVVIHEDAVARVDSVGAGATEPQNLAPAITTAGNEEDS